MITCRCIILNVTIHLYQFFSSMSRALFVLFSYIILHRNWLIDCSQGFGGRKVFFVEKVLMKGRSLICLKRTSDMCMCCYLSKKFVVIWNDCLFLLNDVLKLFSITYRFKTLLKKITKCNNLIKFVKGLKEKNIYIMCEVCLI